MSVAPEVTDPAHYLYRDIDGKSVGIKVFPRVGSTTIFKVFGYGQDVKKFFASDYKVCVVRDPFERLLSVYYGMFRDQKRDWMMQTRGYPMPHDINDLIRFILSIPDDERDVHVRTMTSQLDGWEPKSEELWLLKNFIAEPPHGLDAYTSLKKDVWEHKSKIPAEIDEEIDKELLRAWMEEYECDFELYRRAKNSVNNGGDGDIQPELDINLNTLIPDLDDDDEDEDD